MAASLPKFLLKENVGNLRACSGISGNRITGCSEDRVRSRSIGCLALCSLLQSRQPADLLQSFIGAPVVYENIAEFVSLDGRKRLAGFFQKRSRLLSSL